MAVNPPHEMPHIPTDPVDQGCAASHRITSSPSACSASEYSCGGGRPSLRPVLRSATFTQQYSRCVVRRGPPLASAAAGDLHLHAGVPACAQVDIEVPVALVQTVVLAVRQVL